MKCNQFSNHILLNTSIFFAVIMLACNHKPTKKEGMVLIESGGNLKNFWLDVSPVTVAQFGAFIKSTGYKTQAEEFGDGGTFDFKTGTWTLMKGANWQHPFGKDAAAAPPNHPVTQVSWNDAVAYCKWAKKRLPTSDEFIYAEKNGQDNYDKTYTWGNDFIEQKKYKTNFWQGSFPFKNTVDDGFLTTSPVGYFGENELGLTDMGGNVWNWCADDAAEKAGEKRQRGGSYLCDPAVCHGFKIGGVSSSSAETSLVHVGFRCAKDI